MMKQANQHRRAVLKRVISASTLALVASTGLLLPQRVLAHWPKDAFGAETVEDALLALLDVNTIAETEEVKFKVGSPPSYAVNGGSVPIEIQSDLIDIERIMVLVDKNPYPLILALEWTSSAKLPFKTMIKIAEDSDVIAIIRAGGKLYKTTRFVEVDIGGCG